jgi:hypothetical protein
MNEEEKTFIVSKKIKARTAAEALEREKEQPSDAVYVDKEASSNSSVSLIGFAPERKED